MKLVSFLHKDKERMGFFYEERVFSLRAIDAKLPVTMEAFLRDWDHCLALAREAERHVQKFPALLSTGHRLKDIQLLAPVPQPSSCRDGYAFRQHVEAARRNRGHEMIPQFDEYPVFYFTNHQAIAGPGAISCLPDHLEKLDFELEAAIVICKSGRNIKAADADAYISGLMIMNDFSARTLQMEEMLLNLGPAKGKDFATALGPWLVTPDELKDAEVPCKPGHEGKSWNLEMTAHLNGELLSQGNLSDMDWTFAELIERASYGVDLFPGDVIGSGTVGTGCLLELNGTARRNNPQCDETWLRPGDEIRLRIAGLGELTNSIIADVDAYSILKRKKNQKQP